ncbi:MAG: aminotransferase class V-fold PLP-dependent enzyme [Cyanobium sp.]
MTHPTPNRLRDLCPALANKTYFNYGGQGPLPTPSLEAMVATWRRIQELGPFSGAMWPYLEEETSRLRRHLAQWCGAPPQRLALTENVTMGCVLPLWGLPWQAGDELLISDGEHDGVVAACKELAHRFRMRIHTLPVQQLLGDAETERALVLEDLERALTPRTRLVVLSHLLWRTGQRMPIAAVAERLGAHPQQPWLLVDGAQSFGSLPVAPDAACADLYAFTGHKWCCGPEGLGGVLLSERLLTESRPTLIGWRTLRSEDNAGEGFHRDARRFEVATSCTPLLSGLHTSLSLLESEGSAEERLGILQGQAEALWRGLQQVPGCRPLLQAPPPAGLVSFQLQRPDGSLIEPEQVVSHLGSLGIWLRSLKDPSCVRACTHVTTTPADVERLLEALDRFSAEPAR